jgi:uncharacterized protein (DUF608 family)
LPTREAGDDLLVMPMREVSDVTRQCNCSGQCSSADQGVSRREFIHLAGVGALGMAFVGAAEAGSPKPPPAPDIGKLRRFELTPPRVYSGDHLSAVAMPIGGIGTGTIWLDGKGRLGIWQIFNNHNEDRLPDSFFAVRAQPDGSAAVVRVLQTEGERGFEPVKALSFEGGYPIARLSFQDDALPVKVRLEGFNPLIPTDAANSAIPCALFRLTARNTQDRPVTVSFLGTLQNAVGGMGRPGIQGVRAADYGQNRNVLVREGRMTCASLTARSEPPPSGALQVRGPGGLVAGPAMLWLDELSGLVETAQGGPQALQTLQRVADLSAAGGAIVGANVQPSFFETVAAARTQAVGWDQVHVFEDFEGGNYGGWTAKGEAFAKAPSRGTSPGQQEVSGFMGSGLVNTFVPHDGPQGELVSKPFAIERRYIGFLIGGGNHPNETCINLRVDGKVVRTATGKDQELLEPASWDVSEFVGKQGIIEIVDHRSDSWGHINIDHIVFADAPPEGLLSLRGPVQAIAQALALRFEGAEPASRLAGTRTAIQPRGKELEGVMGGWEVMGYTKLRGLKADETTQVLVQTPDGDPLLLRTSLGKASLFLALAPGLPWSWARACVLAGRGTPLGAGEELVTTAPGYGSMALAVDVPNATCDLGWTDADTLAKGFAEKGELAGVETTDYSPRGQTFNSALCTRFRLQPGQERTVTFVIGWHFPNVERFGHLGNRYARRFANAAEVARYVCANVGNLWAKTDLYHSTVYESNLPEEFLDAMTSQSVIFRGPTCWWDEEDYFAGYEGCYGCCPLNCTHVWNYAQSHARLFPEIDRNMRRSDLITYLHPNGETSHRQHGPTGAFIDGHCAAIEAALRAHQMSPDRSFLEQVWPGVLKATDWMIEAFDKDHAGVPTGHQWNTYDCAVSGENTFIGSQYLSALAAAERMAQVMGDGEAAGRWRAVREAGMRSQNERLWNGEYYIQVPGKPLANDYNTGCHSDQLLGQWWAHMLGLGYLYPRDRVRAALSAISEHNFLERFEGFRQAPRRYIPDDEGGLLMCTWPKGGRPDPFIIYADEVWTGIEYAVAGQMMWEGLVDEARRIVKTARGRYDGRLREGLNSGPGGNPFNELECGKFYARAMSSWGLLIACQGLILDGPAGVLGFKPKWQPEHHRSFFTAPEGWGLYAQQRPATAQTCTIQLRHGRLTVRELVFEISPGLPNPRTFVTIHNRVVEHQTTRIGTEVRVRLAEPVTVTEGETIFVLVT